MSDSSQQAVGHYVTGERLGIGGMGEVLHAVDTRTGQEVAIKRLQISPKADHAAQIERFRREGDMLRQLNHPNIAHVLHTFEDQGQYYIVMEYVAGGSLRDLLETRQEIPIERVLSLALDVADALTRVHRLGIVHRDLKPGNVLLAEDGSARLTDFGVAHLESLPSVTQSGAVIGTTPYLSPEALNGEPVDHRVDIWSFGVMLFEMLAGLHPFEAGPTASVLRAILLSPPRDLEALRPDAPVALVDLIYRMLEKDPQARIPSVRLVGAELESIARQAGQVSGDSPPSTTPRSAPRLRQLTQGADPYAWSMFATVTPDSDLSRANLPAQTTPFIGRAPELEALAQLLADPGVRQITILGPGGMGKTRLSLEAARRHVNHFEHGVHFVPLAAISDPASIVPALADALKFQFYQGGSPRQQLFDFLGEKELLLVLDNFEQLADDARIIAELLEAAPRIKVLVSSRERLNLSAETIFPLGGIDFPTHPSRDDSRDYSAVQLFLTSARRVWPGFELETDDLPAVARVCQLVAGMPLGIVLAAAWVDMLSPQEIAEEIEASLDFLETQMRDVPDRHRSVRAVFESAWARLDAAEQDVFTRLAVFRGGFTRQAAQSVTGITLRQLMALANKSLLRRDPDSGRYEVHELLRQYAEQQLTASGTAGAVRDAHSAHYLDELANREIDLKSRREVEARDAIERDAENMRAAWFHAVEQGHWEQIEHAMEPLWRYYIAQHRREIGRMAFRSAAGALDTPDATGPRAALLGNLLYRQASFVDDLSAGRTLWERSLDLMRANGAADQTAWPSMALAATLVQLGEIDQAETLYAESLALAEAAGDQCTQAWVHRNWGILAGWIREDAAAGETHMQQALALFRATGIQTGIANTLYALGALTHARGDRASTLRHNEEALAIFRATRSRMGEAIVLCAMGWEAYMIGEHEQSRQYNEESLAIRRELGEKGLVPHINLSFTRQALHDHAGARAHAQQALQTLAETRASAFGVYMVISSAMLLAHNKRDSRAVELLALGLNHRALEPDCKSLAEDLRAELEQRLPTEEFAAAWQRGEALDLNATLKELTAEL